MKKSIKSIQYLIQQNPKFQWRIVLLRSLLKGMFLRSWECSEQEKSGEFLFVVGCGRSGNTLLRRLLMDTYSIYIPPETYVLSNQIVRYGRLPQKWWSEKVDVVLSTLEYHEEFKTFGVHTLSPFAVEAKAWPHNKRNFYSLVDGLYRYIGREAGYDAKWIGDKTPLNTLNLGIIHKAFPNAKFLYLERDPIDVVCSYLESGIYKCPAEAAERWKRSVVAWTNFQEVHGEDNCLEIRYEDLVRNPEQKVSEIGLKLNMPILLEGSSSFTKNLGDVELYKHHSNVANPPSPKSIGKGRSKAPESLLADIRPIILDLAKRRGYAEF